MTIDVALVETLKTFLIFNVGVSTLLYTSRYDIALNFTGFAITFYGA